MERPFGTRGATCGVWWKRAIQERLDLANIALTRGFSGAGGFEPATPSLRRMWFNPCNQGF